MVNFRNAGSANGAGRAFARGRLVTALALAIGMAGVATVASAQGSAVNAWVTTRTQAPYTADASFNGYASSQEPVSIVVTLKLRNKEVLDSYTKELFRPGSPSYHQFLSSQESTANFAPTQQQAQAVADYLTGQGFTNVKIASNRLLVTADGSVGAANTAFRTAIGHFTRHGRDGIANTQSAQIPAALNGVVDQVLGLQTLYQARTFSLPASQLRPAYTVVSVTGNSAAHAYYPQEFATVYDAGTTPTASNTTVAILGWGSMTNAVNDLKQLESGQGLTAVPTSIVSTTTKSSSDDSGQGEWGMDAQAIRGISGGVKTLVFYTDGGTYSSRTGSSGASNSGLLQVINKAVSDNSAKVVNMSWGLPECDGSPGFADSAFQLGVTQGQTFSAATGDNGSYPCPVGSSAPENGSYGSKTTLSVNYPASSPYVVATGGTTLNTSASDVYVSEASWPYSGGGVSGSEATPSWQSSSYPHREVPDVAFDADWTNSPIIVYFTASSTSGISQSGYYTNGGTSLASPLFVGAWARLESANSNGLGFAAPALYAYSSQYPFHDVTTGNNGYYAAGTGRDNATGWGSFDIQAANTFIAGTPGFITATKNP